jgi:hypothetical protein
MGLLNQFQVGDTARMSALVFWPVITCHDIMQRDVNANFRYDPTIASEYVKSLASNSGSDNFDKVQTKVVSVETELQDIAKVSRNAATSSQTTSNKSDEVSKAMLALTQRVAKLEEGKR